MSQPTHAQMHLHPHRVNRIVGLIAGFLMGLVPLLLPIGGLALGERGWGNSQTAPTSLCLAGMLYVGEWLGAFFCVLSPKSRFWGYGMMAGLLVFTIPVCLFMTLHPR